MKGITVPYYKYISCFVDLFPHDSNVTYTDVCMCRTDVLPLMGMLLGSENKSVSNALIYIETYLWIGRFVSPCTNCCIGLKRTTSKAVEMATFTPELTILYPWASLYPWAKFFIQRWTVAWMVPVALLEWALKQKKKKNSHVFITVLI